MPHVTRRLGIDAPFAMVASFIHPHDPIRGAARMVEPLFRRRHRHAGIYTLALGRSRPVLAPLDGRD